MTSIAYQIFETPALQEGVPRSVLESMATSYLLSAKYDNESRARSVAKKFIDFCTGRAWVFTNTGSTEAEELYQFTHRTFLEYFAAAHLARTKRTPSDLLEVLLPHISSAEWDVVSQLAVQIMAKQLDFAADEIIDLTLKYQSSLAGHRRTNLLSFIVRCLAFLVPREASVRLAVSALMEASLDESTFARGADSKQFTAARLSPVDLILNVMHVAHENRDPTLEAMRASLEAALSADSVIALDLCTTNLRRYAEHASARAPSDQAWLDSVDGLVDEFRQKLVGRRESPLWQTRAGCAYCFEHGKLSAQRFVTLRGVHEGFSALRNAALGEYDAPEAYRLLQDNCAEPWREWGLAILDAISVIEPPWFVIDDLIYPFERPLEQYLPRRSRLGREDDPRAALMKLVMVTAAFEGLLLFEAEDREPSARGSRSRLRERAARRGSLVRLAPLNSRDRTDRRYHPGSTVFQRRRVALEALNTLGRAHSKIGSVSGSLLRVHGAVGECIEKLALLLDDGRMRLPLD